MEVESICLRVGSFADESAFVLINQTRVASKDDRVVLDGNAGKGEN